jgi:hypothetical protein
MDDSFASAGTVTATNGVDDGAMQGLQAHFLVLGADGIGHVVGKTKSALKDAAFQVHKFSIVSHRGQSEVESVVELRAMVGVFMGRRRERGLVGQVSQLFDFAFGGTYGSQLGHGAFDKDTNLEKIADFLETHSGDEIAASGNHFEQMLVMQAIAGFAEGRAADLVALHHFFFGKENALFDFAADNAFLNALVGFFG